MWALGLLIMKTESYLKIIAVVIGIGILSTHISLTHGVWLIKHGQLIPIILGMAEILRWALGLMASWWLFRLRTFSIWLLFLSFLFGLCSSWISFIPFGGYAIELVSPTSWVQNFMVIQGPNFILVIMVLWLFDSLKKSNNKLQPTANRSAE